MPLKLETALTTARGPFNPHIVTPDWLVKTGVCKPGDAGMKYFPLSQGVAFGFNDVKWQVDFTSLTVESRDADCGDLAAKVMGLLSHTPVVAVGNNFQFGCSREDWGSGPLPALASAGWPKGGTRTDFLQTNWSGLLRDDDALVEIVLADLGPLVGVVFNFHRDTKEAAAAVAAAGRFRQDYARSEALMKQVFAQEVSP